MAKLCTIEGVTRGDVTVRHLMTLNSLLDAEEYQRQKAQEADKK